LGPDFKLLFCNEQGDCAKGFYRGRNFVYVPQWNVTGTINRPRNFISWSNGTQWYRYNQPPRNEIVVEIGRPAIGGAWFHDGTTSTIRMTGDGVHFVVLNGFAQPVPGILRGKELVLPLLAVSGRLHKHGTVISWSNGTTWYRS